jgi:hypothetical protein
MNKYLKLLELCLKAKDKGHTCLYYCFPHTNRIEITIYLNGFEAGKVADTKFVLYTDDERNVADRAIQYLESLTEEELIETKSDISELENVLRNYKSMLFGE